jgi:hypothetical protein
MPELRLGLNDKVMFEATGRGKRDDMTFMQARAMLTNSFFSL